MTRAADERPAIVTGASSGIGAATARVLAQAGHPVVLGARRLDRCEELAEKIRADGQQAHALPLDIADPRSADTFTREARRLVGDVDIIVSNAGRTQPGRAVNASTEQFQQHLDVNVLGAQALMRAFAPTMVQRAHGDIVFVTSEVVQEPRPGVAAYVTSKWAVEGLAHAMQMEMDGTGVRVSIVRPGPTMTEMGWDWDPTVTHKLITEWQRWGLARHSNFLPPEGVAGAVLAVVSAPADVHFRLIEVEPVAPVASGEEPTS
ncbi:MAG: SDR family oxidoreductase [Actinomycetes bacterium]